ncbi:hypothetical protein IMG5_048560 [Ichthyophthirius multifiliis]|uniref:Cyclic nucleotide-binding domain-containing protein n=1 Tax=Ichthyophthirius multifiliis TaxID=5932 RepID=G0QMG4_ICHMU|nr:hypothetical protein IMG5_048560 [Ichthyophthirius multifiliis]EGR33586.1 hypothetical protein IMG5_048560 [Ichthyophthirius multifiliis]|eukprot:XP_004037572.1 hypothetical protein IMG5_048560 [Ichthyophthirius multifiliis]
MTVTMVTVGYGDITPLNVYEKQLSILTILIACGIFAFSVSSINNIMSSINEEKRIINQKLQIINEYMQIKNVSFELRHQIREYLEYFWKKSYYHDQQITQKIIESLNQDLKQKLMVEANHTVFKHSIIFNENYSNSLKYKIISIIREQQYSPEQIIIQSNDKKKDYSIYFIESGEVEFFIEGKDIDGNDQVQVLVTLKKGMYFNEINFFTQQQIQNISVRSQGFCTILKIDANEFINQLKEFPEDYNYFCHMKDNIIYNQQYQIINSFCYSCQLYDHQLNNCNLIHHIPKRSNIILRHLYDPKTIERQYFKRKKKKQFKTIMNLQQLQLKAIQYSNLTKKSKKSIYKIDSDYDDYEISSQQSSEYTDSNMYIISILFLQKKKYITIIRQIKYINKFIRI